MVLQPGENLSAITSRPAEAGMELGNKVLLLPEHSSFAFDPVWGNGSLSVHSPWLGKFQPWLAPAQCMGSLQGPGVFFCLAKGWGRYKREAR